MSCLRPSRSEDLGEPVDREVVGERVRSEAGDPGDVLRVADDVRRQALAGAGLGDVEAGLVVEDDAEGERRLGARLRRDRRHLVAPAHPAGAGEVQDQVEAGRLDVEELAVPGDVVDHRALERGQRRVEGLEGAERGDVDLRDGVAVEPAPQVEGQGFHLGQLGHAVSLGRTGDRPCASGASWRGARRTSAAADGVDLPRRPRWRPRAAGLLAPGGRAWSCCRCGARTSAPGSFRLAIDEVPALIEMLRAGLVRSYEDARDRLGVVASESA